MAEREIISILGCVQKVKNTAHVWNSIYIKSHQEFPGCEASDANKFSSIKTYYGWISGENLSLCEGLEAKFHCFVAKSGEKTYLNCKKWEYELPNTAKAIKSFLFSILGKRKLLSYEKISKMVDKYADATLDLFREGNENALYDYFFGSNGTSNPEKFEKYQEAIKRVQEYLVNNEFVSKMTELGIPVALSKRIYKETGIDSIEKLKEHPYICLEVNGLTFQHCESIAKKLGCPRLSKERAIAATIYEVENNLGQDTYMLLDTVIESVKKKYLTDLNQEEISRLNKVYAEGLKEYFQQENSKIYAMVVEINKKPTKVIMLKKDLKAEVNSERKLRALISSEHKCLETEMVERLTHKLNSDEEVSKRGWKYADGQINAIINSLTHKVSIITGGPGTGKTTVTNAIIQLWKELNVEPVTCMAPTGKAATRMREQTGEKAQTIHKTVHIIPGEEAELNALKRGLIIVDESSMIDQETLEKMLACVPTGSSLLFLGDIDQLPSVGRGNVLQELLKYGRETGKIAVSVLTETKRQAKGSPIIDNATKINHGDYQLFYDGSEFEFVQGKDKDVEILKKLYLEKVSKYGVDQVAVLCPNRNAHIQYENGKLSPKYKMASQWLNNVLRDAVNPKKEGQAFIEVKFPVDNTNPKEIKSETVVFREGDKVMSWKNKDQIANGDIGQITSIKEDVTHQMAVTIKWESGETIVYNRDEMKDQKITLAYALSIHKSQGSEYACVIMPFTIDNYAEAHYTRNLLYTGVTRAKKECVLLGDQVAIKKTILNKQTGKRKSLLSYWLVNEK